MTDQSLTGCGGRAEIMKRLQGAHIVPATMSLVHLTGDLSLLDDIAPYVQDAWDYSVTVPEEVAARVRSRLASAMERHAAGARPALPMPDPTILRRMMSVAVGEEVPPDYIPMVLEQMSLAPAGHDHVGGRLAPERGDLQNFRVAIVGAGASGLCAAIKLKEAGIQFTVFEKNEEVGGTWYENRYPGCTVDTPNHFYQFSFAPNNDWPNYYSQQPSILAYLKGCADSYGLRPHIRLGCEVLGASYDEAEQLWTVSTRGRQGREERLVVNVLICAVGQLNRPAIPEFPGLERFDGEQVHTATWPESLDLAGRRVALIGTGASAIQVGPSIVDQVASLTVYQRSGNWITRSPNIHRVVSDDKKWALNAIPFYAPWYRFQLFWGFADGLFPALRMDPSWDGRRDAVSEFNERRRQSMMRYMRRELEGRDDLLAKVTPAYPPYGKRVLADPGWYKMLRRDHVELVTSAIERIEPRAIRLADGRSIETDVIVFATGFQAARMLWPMDIKGRQGRSIRQVWGVDDPRAYLGITVPGFPNLFVLYGPNTNLGHGGSAIFLAECQVRYCMSLLRAMITKGYRECECRQDVHDAYNQRIDRELAQLVWSHPSVSTWYKNKRGRIVTNQPWRLVDYWRMTREAALSDYRFSGAA